MQIGSKVSLQVSLVIAGIIYIYFSTVLVFINKWFGLGSSPGMLNAVVFTAVAFMCVYSYTRAMFTDPGRVPRSYVPDVEDAHNLIHEIKRKVLLVGSLAFKAEKDEQDEGSFRTIYVISGFLLVPLSVALSILVGWHSYLMLQNKTTIEYHEGVRAMCLAEKGGYVYSHPYDIGAFENLISILGPNILCWLCPASGHVGSGLHFRTALDKLTAMPS